nr:hypothetical protein GCM10025699_25390 [Microbacterium flavescens]
MDRRHREHCQRAPGDLLPWIEGWPGTAALGVVGLAAGIVIAVRRSSRPARAAVVLSAVVLSTVAGVVAGSSLLTSVAGRWTLPQDWAVLACDVGQGDAILLRSGEAIALVDTGPAPEPLAACLDRAGVGRIDLLVLSHFDLDHAGGIDAVLGRVGTVLHGPAGSSDDRRTLDILARGGARLADARAGLSGALADASWRVVWPPPAGRAFPAGNDASVVIDIRGEGSRRRSCSETSPRRRSARSRHPLCSLLPTPSSKSPITAARIRMPRSTPPPNRASRWSPSAPRTTTGIRAPRSSRC